MATVFLSIGSNIERYQHISAGLNQLAERFGELRISPVYESEAVGFSGDHFLNLVVGVETDLSVGELSTQLRAIEDACGRRRDGPRFGPRTLDIDILTYDDVVGLVEGVELPRGEILENAFVLCPLAELAPQAVHPVLGQTYAELWDAYDQAAQPLSRVAFEWRGRVISVPS